MRFSGLHQHIDGISQKMLSRYLKSLVRYGLAGRLVEPAVPPRVTYGLTPLGQSPAQQPCALLRRFTANAPALEAARQRYDAADSPARWRDCSPCASSLLAAVRRQAPRGVAQRSQGGGTGDRVAVLDEARSA